jgi:hypothetical protein
VTGDEADLAAEVVRSVALAERDPSPRFKQVLTYSDIDI